MTQFIQETELQDKLAKIFEAAKKEIVIVSPFIHLHDRFKAVLERKRTEGRVSLKVVFGKNTDDPLRSIWFPQDREFFSSFENVEIRYEPRLHAKYYANEHESLITSLNLIASSTNHNVEVGVYSRALVSGRWLDRVLQAIGLIEFLDLEASNYFRKVSESSELIFLKENGIEKVNNLGLLNKRQELQTSNGLESKEVYSEEEDADSQNEIEHASDSTNADSYSHVTTTKLATRCGLDRKELNKRLNKDLKYQEWKDGKWYLTERGVQAGGKYRDGEHGEFIVWPVAMFD